MGNICLFTCDAFVDTSVRRSDFAALSSSVLGGSQHLIMAKDAENNSNAHQRATSEPPDKPTGPLSVPVSSADRDVVKVNNYNVTELKNACDDAVKRVRCLTLFTRNSLT